MTLDDPGAGSVGGKAADARPENRVAIGDPGAVPPDHPVVTMAQADARARIAR
jgi:hypothetical protein